MDHNKNPDPRPSRSGRGFPRAPRGRGHALALTLAALLLAPLPGCAHRRAPESSPSSAQGDAQALRRGVNNAETEAEAAWEGGRAGAAVAHYDRALSLAEPLGDPALTSRLLNDRGVALAAMGLRGQALESLTEAYRLRLTLSEGPGVSPVLYNQGMILWQLERPDAAARAFTEGLAAAPPEERPAFHLALAELALDRGDGPQTLTRADDALAALRALPEAPHPREEAQAAALKGLGLALFGDPEGALMTLEDALARWDALGDTLEAGQVAYNLGLIAEDAGEMLRAREAYLRALAYAEARGDDASEALITERLASLGALPEDPEEGSPTPTFVDTRPPEGGREAP